MPRSVAAAVVWSLLLVVPCGVAADPPLPLPRVPVCGDQGDFGPPPVLNCADYIPAADARAFQVTGSGPVEIRFDFVFREATAPSELLVYRVDGPDGAVEGLPPGAPGYAAAVLNRALRVFAVDSTPATPDVELTFEGGDVIAFSLVSGGTLEDLLANNPDNSADGAPVAFFSFEAANPDTQDHFIRFTPLTGAASQIAFEDLLGGFDSDFDDVVYEVSRALVPASDIDDDGLPDEWEATFGLDPSSAAGGDGPGGDPDGDGVDNLTEFQNGSHPRGFHRRYFAEGATGSLFSTSVALLNPDIVAATAVLSFQRRRDGLIFRRSVAVPGLTRVTVNAGDTPGLEDAEFSTVLESEQSVIADRTMRWDATGYGSHTETSVAAPATRWYLAEGATNGGFDLFYLLQNPNDVAADVEIKFLLPSPALPVVRQYHVQPNRRENVWVDLEPGLASTEVSAVVTASVPIIVERAMYLSRPGQKFVAGHESAALTAPATQWFLAEGATGPYFDLFVLIANPNEEPAHGEARYLLPGGAVVTRPWTIEGDSRKTIWVDIQGPELANTAVSTWIVSDVPVLVERAMWWPGPVAAWAEAHNSPGATATGVKWALAEGEVGGPFQSETYILIANTSAWPGQARVTLYFEDGGTAERVVLLPATSRVSVPVGSPESLGGFGPLVANKRFGAIVESLAPADGPPAQVVVERAMYSNAGGRTWAAGTNALGTRLQ